MATSGTYGFTPEFARIIDDAFERVGVAPNAITGAHVESAFRSLDFIFDDWSNFGDRLPWSSDITTTSFVATQDNLTFTGGVIDILSASVRRSNVDTPMTRISEADYLAIPNKAVAGRPFQFYVDLQQAQIVAKFWPVPENSTDIFVYRRLRVLQSPGAMVNNPHVRPGWNEALTATLAAYLAEKYAPERLAEKTSLAGAKLQNALAGSRDRASTRLRVAVPGRR